MSVVRTLLSAFPLSGFFTGGVAHGTGNSQSESSTDSGAHTRNHGEKNWQDNLQGVHPF